MCVCACLCNARRCNQVLLGKCGHSACRGCLTRLVSTALLGTNEHDVLKPRKDVADEAAAAATDGKVLF